MKPKHERYRVAARVAGCAVATLALLAVFAAYQSPALAVDLATRVWNCL